MIDISVCQWDLMLEDEDEDEDEEITQLEILYQQCLNRIDSNLKNLIIKGDF